MTTSPSACTMLCPERIDLSKSKEFGSAKAEGVTAAIAEAALAEGGAGSGLAFKKGAAAEASPAPGGISPGAAACRPLKSRGGIANSSQDGSAPSTPMILMLRAA